MRIQRVHPTVKCFYWSQRKYTIKNDYSQYHDNAPTKLKQDFVFVSRNVCRRNSISQVKQCFGGVLEIDKINVFYILQSYYNLLYIYMLLYVLYNYMFYNVY